MKIKGKVYRIKEGTDLSKFRDLGYEAFDSDPPTLIKIVPQDINGDLCVGSLNGIYNNPEWRTKIYSYHRKEIEKALGLKYRHGKAVLGERFKHVLTDWRIQIEPTTDGWLGFSSMDPFDRKIYYASVHLDTYCADEIKTLLDNDLIELIDVEQDVPDEDTPNA